MLFIVWILTVCVYVAGMYFFAIVQGLVNDGYVRGDDIRGAPYDWRKAPSKLYSTAQCVYILAKQSITTMFLNSVSQQCFSAVFLNWWVVESF